MLPDVSEFKKFYGLLLSSAPRGYIPHLFVAEVAGKAPISGRAWSHDKARLSFDEAIRWLKYNFNIAIAGMNDNLIIVDIDNESAIDPDTLVPTLSVRSRSRTGSHFFYYIDRIEDKKNIAIPDVGELRAQHQYVICAGSYVMTDPTTVPNDQQEFAGYYTLENAVPPTHITFNELPLMFRKQYIYNYLIPSIKDKMAEISRIFDAELPNDCQDRKSRSTLFDLEVVDVVHVPNHGGNFASPLHGSKNGKNCTYSDGWLHCFRCGCSHNALTCLAVMAGADTCSNAGYGHSHSCSGNSSIDMKNGQTSYRIWNYARQQGYIPTDDPPPSSALRWFVVEAGICRKDEIEEWRIPEWAYREARHLLRVNI